ncbi:MAG: DUF5666 domain-containing protein [Vicinamibacterales bacterium]
MKSWLAVVAVALVALLVCAPAASSQTKWVRGNVVSVAGDTLVVKAQGKDWTFKVDKTTGLTARGAGKAQAKAEAAGEAGVKFADFVKPGMGVEVHYKDAGGILMATDVHSGLPPTEGTASAEEATVGGSARGTITALSAASLTLKAPDKEWVFTVDSKTLVVGEGLGAIDRQFKAQGKGPALTDLLGVNDHVIVYFKDAADAKRAFEVRVMQKAMK